MSARDEPLQELMTSLPEPSTLPVQSVSVLRLAAFGIGGAWVSVQASRPPVAARSAIALYEDDVDREFIVAFDGGDPAKPLILGRIVTGDAALPARLLATVDGERLSFSAREQLVLECGSASITLTRSGKVLIRGEYVQSRASGINAIKGGSVELN